MSSYASAKETAWSDIDLRLNQWNCKFASVISLRRPTIEALFCGRSEFDETRDYFVEVKADKWHWNL